MATTASPTRNHRIPTYRITVDGRDITPTVNARLVSLSLQEARGEAADQLDLTLSDHDGALQIPRKGVTLTLALGYQDEALVDKGRFVVDEAEHAGAPDQLTIRARSADLRESLRVRRDVSWHDTNLGQVLTTLAARHGLNLRVDPSLRDKPVQHVDQTESDIHFITRLAQRHDAVATVKAGHLLFLPINGTRTSTGLALPTFTITRASGDSHRYQQADRDTYTGVRAYWHDGKRANRKSVLVGSAVNEKVLKETHATEADARESATAEWGRVQRGLATLSLTLAQGEATLAPQTPVMVRGFKPEMDGTDWLVVRLTHTLDDNGWTTQVEMEIGGAV